MNLTLKNNFFFRNVSFSVVYQEGEFLAHLKNLGTLATAPSLLATGGSVWKGQLWPATWSSLLPLGLLP
jgi:hypothetical protein